MLEKELLRIYDTAYNGFEGFNKFVKQNYDLVICDVNMPIMDGYQFCINTVKHFQDKNKFFASQQEEYGYQPYQVACLAFVDIET